MLNLPKIIYKLVIFFIVLFFSTALKAQVGFILNSTYCVGDSIKVTANTGTLSATGFSWTASSNGVAFSTPNQSVTNVIFSSAGNYTVELTVSAGTLTSSATQAVTVHSLPMVTLSCSKPFVCTNDDATLTASGALSYVWSPTVGLYFFSNSLAHISPISTVAYTLVGTDSVGCKGNASYTVNVFNYPSLVVLGSSPNVCVGSTTTLTANGASSYTWTGLNLPNASNQTTLAVGPGTYSLVGSNGGCKDSTVIQIGVAPSITLVISRSREVICINDADSLVPVSLQASGAFLYTWEPYQPAHMSFSLGAITAVSPTISTCYTLTGSTSECKASKVICVKVATCTSIEKIEKELEASIFQDPVSEKLVVQLKNSESCLLKIYNLTGRLIIEKEIIKIENIPFELTLSDFSKGIYLIDIVGRDKKFKKTKFIKQ